MRILVMARLPAAKPPCFDLCSELLQGHRAVGHFDLNDVVYLQKIKTEGFPHILTPTGKPGKQVAKWGPDLIHNHSSHTLPTALT